MCVCVFVRVRVHVLVCVCARARAFVCVPVCTPTQVTLSRTEVSRTIVVIKERLFLERLL